jgi:hypothetical protein
MIFVPILLAIGALLALAIVAALLSLIGMLLFAGIISSSIAIGVLRKSVAGGFQALFLQLGAIFGIIAGLGATHIAGQFREGMWDSPLRWAVGAMLGFLFGIGAAWLFNFGWMRLAVFLMAKGSVSGKKIEGPRAS